MSNLQTTSIEQIEPKRLTAKEFLEEFAKEVLEATDVVPIINGYAKHLEARELELQS
jgi:phospholipid N-methyltransferase